VAPVVAWNFPAWQSVQSPAASFEVSLLQAARNLPLSQVVQDAESAAAQVPATQSMHADWPVKLSVDRPAAQLLQAAPSVAALNVPVAHAVHAASAMAVPAVRLWPAVQVGVPCATQAAPSVAALNVPVAQAVHAASALAVPAVRLWPAKQVGVPCATQAAPSVAALNVPVAHAMHATSALAVPAVRLWPAKQVGVPCATQAAPSVAALNVPVAQAVHAASAMAVPAVRPQPAVQLGVVCSMQAPLPSVLNVPLAQATADVARVAL
jgi:hypothetical protein